MHWNRCLFSWRRQSVHRWQCMSDRMPTAQSPECSTSLHRIRHGWMWMKLVVKMWLYLWKQGNARSLDYLHQNISVSSADQTLKTLLILDSDRQHTAISGFHIRRPTLMNVRLQSPGQCHGTDYQQQSGHLTLFRISRTNWKLTSFDGTFLFSFSFISNAGAL